MIRHQRDGESIKDSTTWRLRNDSYLKVFTPWSWGKALYPRCKEPSLRGGDVRSMPWS